MKRTFSIDIAGRQLNVETGQLAQLANGAVMVKYGDTVILSTATASAAKRRDRFFPLSVDYEERLMLLAKFRRIYKKRGKTLREGNIELKSYRQTTSPSFSKGFKK